MISGWAWNVILYLAVGAVGVGIGVMIFGMLIGGADEDRDRDRTLLLSRLTSAFPAQSRVELVLSDWGAEHGEMRWRWTLWDADRVMHTILDEETHRLMTPRIGFTSPYMLGNQPTKALAQASALAWMDQVDATLVAFL